MPVEDQYYFPNTEGDKEIVAGKVTSYFSSPLLDLNELVPSDNGIQLVVHGPSSLFHVERVHPGIAGVLLKDIYGKVVLHPQTGEELQIPYSARVAENILDDFFEAEIGYLEANIAVKMKNLYSRLDNEKSVGDYHPAQLGAISEGSSISPAKFMLATAMKIARERETSMYQGPASVFVMHPDILFFLAQGNLAEVGEKARVLEEALALVGFTSAYENVSFGNTNFRKILSWAIDPIEMSGILPETVGICIDVNHLERLGWSQERIANCIKYMARARKLCVVHLDKFHSALGVGKDYVSAAFSEGAHVVYEPRDRG